MKDSILVNAMYTPLEEHYICYFDILGYKDFFDKNPDEHKNFLIEVLMSDASIESILRNTDTEIELKYRAYSDNFIIFFPKFSSSKCEALRLLSIIVRKIQIKLLMEFSMIIRGGITCGEFFANDKILFGTGLIKAYDMENSIAQYPRVIIDNEFFKEELQELELKNFIKKDNDEQYYVNYFYDENALKLIKGKCEKLIEKHGKYDLRIKDPKKIFQQEKTINKHVWLLVKFNERCEEIGCEKLKMNYILKINSKLFKMEVSCCKNENIK